MLVLAGTSIALAVLCAPYILWAYNMQQAGRAMAAGLVWPEPRRSDSLPEQRDPTMLAAALGHLAAAQRWQPDRAQAYRWAGQVYAAQGDWLNAAGSYEQARERDPEHLLLAWESALIYEQMQQRIETAPRETLLSKLVSAPRESQTLPGGSDSCWGNQPDTCFVGLDSWTKPYAVSSAEPPVTYDALVMHAPGGVRLTHTISASHLGLSFLLGLDPNVGAGQSDGATYRILIETTAGPQQIYERTLDRATADQGWIPDMVDLSPWAGQTITLIFRLDGGPAGDTRDDWYGWGNVLLTTTDVARFATYVPAARWNTALRGTGSDVNQFIEQGDLALEAGAYDRAALWYKRALVIEPPSPSLQFRSAVASIAAQVPIPARVDLYMLEVQTLTDHLQIEAESLRWLTQRPYFGVAFGDPLRTVPSADPATGTLWWNGAAATIINVLQDGDYSIVLRAQNTPPAPVELQIEHNYVLVATCTLEKENMMWDECVTRIHLQSGMHVIGVRFKNDGGQGGIDRNAVLDWISIQTDD